METPEFRCSCDGQLTDVECLVGYDCSTNRVQLAEYCRGICDGRFGPNTSASMTCANTPLCRGTGQGTTFFMCQCFTSMTWDLVKVTAGCREACPGSDVCDCPAGSVPSGLCTEHYASCQ